jgi:hypothetical protein
MQTISTRKAIKTIELWQEQDVNVVLVSEYGDPASQFEMHSGKVEARDDMGGLVIFTSGETPTVIRPDRFEGINLVQDAQGLDDFAAMRFVGGYGLRDVILIALGDRPLDVGALIILSALTDSVADEEEEIPGPAEEQGAEEAQDTEDSAWEPGRLPYWPPRGED